MEYAVQVPADVYLSHYTDLLHAQEETDALVSYVEAGLRVNESRDLTATGWRDLGNLSSVSQDKAFQVLEEISENIHDLCLTWNEEKDHPKLRQRTTRLICCANHETLPGVRGASNARSMLLLLEDGSEVNDENEPTSTVVAIAEFMRSINDRAENECKVLSAVSHILHNDPCRRFVLAFTIEEQMMRFWYFSRAHITVSAEFNHHIHSRLFIHFIIFLTYAPLRDLGYDPTIERISIESAGKKEVQYRIKVGGKLYQTLRPLNETTLDILSHATRVWEVVELDSDLMYIGKSLALKDVWRYTGTKGEREIYDEIFTALGDLDRKGVVSEIPPPLILGARLVKDAKRYFMTIISDEVVVIDGQPDTALGPPVGYSESIYEERADFDGSIPIPKIPLAYKERTHRRIIFEEVCQTMYQISDFAEFTLGVSQLVYGLAYLRLAGFIHRDLSPGNCLMYKGQVKISDLEYTVEYLSQVSTSAPPTGTPAYMASEYQLGHYVFQPTQPIAKPSLSPAPLPSTVPVATFVPFRYNYLHDLESVLWIYLWFLLSTLLNGLSAKDPEEKHKHVFTLYHKLFDGSLHGSTERHFFISCHRTDSSAFNEALDIIRTAYGNSDITLGMNCFRFLAYCYQTVEATQPICTAGSNDSKHWNPRHFLHEYYVELHETFKYIHGKMKDPSSSFSG